MQVTGFTLVSVILMIVILLIVTMMFFEKYFVNIDNKQLVRVMLFALVINVGILFFLVFSFSKVKFARGVIGPSGMRGRPGRNGKTQTLQQCHKQSKNLGQAKYEKDYSDIIVLQRPVIKE